MELRALTWNLFHGRDHPPDRALDSWRSRILRITERDATHAQVNRNLYPEFAALLAGAEWDLALLQECPPRWSGPLAEATAATAHRVLTSRNSLAPLRALLARLNPDLVASNEGGSNLTLVRGEIVDRRQLELTPGPDPERRAMAFTRAVPARFGVEVCVANLHASAGPSRRAEAEREVLLAAERAGAWAAGAPLLFGGDLNLRPRDTDVFEQLEQRFGLRQATAPDSLDHLLVAGLELAEEPAPWPPERREVADGERLIRLSDHTPVQAAFVK
jgi:endonuclease/exonuclease/phosphatase family metal-dependent hydrolase